MEDARREMAAEDELAWTNRHIHAETERRMAANQKRVIQLFKLMNGEDIWDEDDVDGNGQADKEDSEEGEEGDEDQEEGGQTEKQQGKSSPGRIDMRAFLEFDDSEVISRDAVTESLGNTNKYESTNGLDSVDERISTQTDSVSPPLVAIPSIKKFQINDEDSVDEGDEDKQKTEEQKMELQNAIELKGQPKKPQEAEGESVVTTRFAEPEEQDLPSTIRRSRSNGLQSSHSFLRRSILSNTSSRAGTRPPTASAMTMTSAAAAAAVAAFAELAGTSAEDGARSNHTQDSQGNLSFNDDPNLLNNKVINDFLFQDPLPKEFWYIFEVKISTMLSDEPKAYLLFQWECYFSS